jgi:Transcriptional regulator, contains sigma factor-related N-terminal domain
MTRIDEIGKLVQIARQYYEQNLTQDEIAANFGLSRPTVSRMLKKALEEKLFLSTSSTLSAGARIIPRN